MNAKEIQKQHTLSATHMCFDRTRPSSGNSLTKPQVKRFKTLGKKQHPLIPETIFYYPDI